MVHVTPQEANPFDSWIECERGAVVLMCSNSPAPQPRLEQQDGIETPRSQDRHEPLWHQGAVFRVRFQRKRRGFLIPGPANRNCSPKPLESAIDAARTTNTRGWKSVDTQPVAYAAEPRGRHLVGAFEPATTRLSGHLRPMSRSCLSACISSKPRWEVPDAFEDPGMRAIRSCSDGLSVPATGSTALRTAAARRLDVAVPFVQCLLRAPGPGGLSDTIGSKGVCVLFFMY
jgi:hypothetical protein